MGQEKNSTKKEKWKQLSERERYEIEVLLKSKRTPTEIENQLGRDRRTIEREIKRGQAAQVDSLWRKQQKYCADQDNEYMIKEERIKDVN